MQIKKATLTALLTKAGLDPESESWKAIAGKDAAETDDELAPALFTELSGKLLSLEDAKKHPEVEGAIKGKYWGLVDDQVKEFLKGSGLDEAGQLALMNGKATPDKVKAALAKVAELSKVAGKAGDDQREKEWQTKSQEFQTKITDLETKYNTELQGRAVDQRDFALTSFLTDPSQVKLRGDMPNISRFARMTLLDKLPAGAAVDIRDGQPVLVMKDDPTKPYHATGAAEPTSWKEYATTTLESEKFLNAQPGNQHQIINTPTPAPAGGQPVDSAAASSFAANAAMAAPAQ